jgi:two-component system CheB/CheR fusion protein
MKDEPINEFTDGEREPEHGGSGGTTAATSGTQHTSTPITSDGGDEAVLDPQLPFHIVGLGASAGGVEAYIELFQHLSPRTGMAFVVVTHLAADQKSRLREILTRHTGMPVIEIENGMRPEPNKVYVLAPGSYVHLDKGSFRLEPNDDRSPRTVDVFLRSLAASQKNRSIGVILSGMDGDGALGLRAVKGEGGITIVQSPETAKFPDMPKTSIAADPVDAVLPPHSIATQIEQLGEQFRTKGFRSLIEAVPSTDEERSLARIVSLMRGVSGVDFRLYKPATIRRRIARRMVLHRFESIAEYADFLQTNPAEIRDLHEDALINVTYFFRDTDVFDNLKAIVFPSIFEDRDPGQQVRVWVAGCSTGEEVYSIAICLLEYLTGNAVEPPIQIFGTDASELNIQRARAGVYPETITAEVSPERLRRFFVKTLKGYQVMKRVRDLCIFARQNLCHDPPFSRMDLISCRNVLIYFGAELQRQLIPAFHYALRPDGFLLLGSSETIREFTDLFALRDRKGKIYQRTEANNHRAAMDLLPRILMPDLPSAGSSVLTEVWSDVELQRAADRLVLTRYGPPGVVVNDRMEILQSRGHTSPFLEMRQGAATLQLGRMARESIAGEVTAAVRRAIEEEVPVQVPGLKVSDETSERSVTLEIFPIHSVASRSRCYLVLFVPSQAPVQPSIRVDLDFESNLKNPDLAVTQLRHDLSATKLYLQSLLEERDAKNQELVSANEEIQSANEELQSTNEELETTKEELQSSNEELQTVNDELQNRNTILTQASNDLYNLLNSVNLPVLMVSNSLDIRHFTPPTQQVMNLRSTDLGRPFGEIRMNLEIDDLTPILLDVLETLAPREMEVKDREGHWHLLRIRPYRTTDNRIEGLVIVLVDIDQLRRSQQDLRSARDFAGSILASIPLPLVVVDLKFRIRSWNEAFCILIGLTSSDLESRLLPEVVSQLFGSDSPLRSELEKLKNYAEHSRSFSFERQTSAEQPRVFCIRGRVLEPDGEQFFLLTFEDITAHKEAERLLKLTTRELGRSQEELRSLTSSLLTTQESERRRIARELHDDVIQRVAALGMDSEEIRQAILVDPLAALNKLQQLQDGLGTLAEDVRTMSHRLHPSVLDDMGLTEALRALTEDADRSANMIATFMESEVPERIPMETATALFRIAQEALRNAIKHAGRTHVRVALRGTAEGVQLEIADAGYGFDMEENRSGLGIISMEERARIVGGTMKIRSALGQGTTIIVDVPLIC